jgi:hypothetical protein
VSKKRRDFVVTLAAALTGAKALAATVIELCEQLAAAGEEISGTQTLVKLYI